MHYAIIFLEMHDRGPSMDMSVQSRWNDSAVQSLCPIPSGEGLLCETAGHKEQAAQIR